LRGIHADKEKKYVRLLVSNNLMCMRCNKICCFVTSCMPCWYNLLVNEVFCGSTAYIRKKITASTVINHDFSAAPLLYF
jgi:hypothetical protein